MNSPAHSTRHSQYKCFSLICCCFPIRSRTNTEEIKEKPFQVNHEIEAPNLEQPPATRLNANHTSKESVATVYDLPPGWRAVPSRSKPNRTAFLNEFTGERISWVPNEPASTEKGEIRKSKRKNKMKNGSVGSSGSDGTRKNIGNSKSSLM